MPLSRTDKVVMVPASGVHTGITDIMYKIGDYIKYKFPEGFFKSYHYETKDGFMSHYAELRRKQIKGNPLEYTKQKKPRLVVLYDNRTSDTRDTGLGDVSPFTYPMVQGVHPELMDYIHFYRDPLGCILMTSDKRVKTEISLVIELNSSSDQESVLNYLENSLKMQYGTRLRGIDARFIIPNELISILKTSLFFQDMQQMLEEKDLKKKKIINDMIDVKLEEYLSKYSNGGILIQKLKNNDDGYVYVYKRTYTSIYFEVTGLPEKTDGDKKGEVYDKFTVTLNAFFEFYKPITYLLKTPEIINGYLFDDVIKISRMVTKTLDNIPIGLAHQAKKQQFRSGFDLSMNLHKDLIWAENNITLVAPIDEINIIEWMDKPQDKFYKKFLEMCDQYEFDKIFKIIIYEDSEPMEDNLYKTESKGLVTIYDANPASLYTIYLYGSKKDIEYLNKNRYHIKI